MMSKILIEFLSTVIFSFFVFSSGNYLIVGAVLALIIYFTKGFAFVNPAIAFSKWVEGSITTPFMIQIIGVELLGAIVGLQLYSIIYKGGLKFRK
jgi:glycerol uptake facilitator-like aquaporin